MRRSQRIESLIKELTHSYPPTAPAIIRTITFLVEERDEAHLVENKPRPGHACPDPEGSPDGVCTYWSDYEWETDADQSNDDRRYFVELKIGADWVKHYLPPDYDPTQETSDSCIFCGHPEERK